MNDSLQFALTFGAALGCGVNAGVFFAFSTFVMTALARLPTAQGIAAMQSINVLAVTPLFMSAFFGTGAACVVLAVAAGPLQTSSDGYVLAGSAAYLAGALLVTIFFHVPLNNRLAAARPTDAAGQLLWAFYIRRWTAWNHVRTVACVLAAAMLIRALR